MSQHVKISVKGQIVIPKDVRDALDWTAGMELEVMKGTNSVTFRPKLEKRERITFEEFKRRIPKYDGPYVPESEWRGAIEEMFRREWK